jgi:hypothetical protein
MRPVLAALLAVTLAILPACGLETMEVRPATVLRKVVLALPDTAHNKLTSRAAEFARDHELRFYVPENLAGGI